MNKFITIVFISLSCPLISTAQNQTFSLEDCINYALENSTDINRAQNDVSIQNAYLEQSKAARLPNLQLGVNQQLSSTSNYNTINTEWNRNSNNSVNASLSTQVTLYNGLKLKNTILQNQLNFEASELNIQTEKELLSLNILSFYIDVLLAKDNLKNSKLQLEATQKQLKYAEARKEAGAISLSDLLYIKSQLASDKTAYIETASDLRLALVYLMQLMNMPISDDFDIQEPDIVKIIDQDIETNPQIVYDVALGLQPNVEMAKLNLESTKTEISIVESGYMPSLSLNGGLSTGYASNFNNLNIGDQFTNGVSPFVGLNLTIPIYQRKQIKTQVKVVKIQTNNSEMELIDIKNSLRKYIEQACTNVQTAQSNYIALQDQLDAEKESYQLANEMFIQGMLNSVDFLQSKNNLIIAENKFTQAKYNLLLQYKIVEYYLGNSILL
ncbi:MAG: TolC family protein [Bacteroidota bacterium]|nr:TolC family protein [Bacteroidota bacterium]